MANAPKSLEDVISEADLESRYIKENLRGCGAFGNVHIYGIKTQFAKAAEHKRIAVKTNKDDYGSAAREIRNLLALIKEPHIVNIISFSRSPDIIVMECYNSDLSSYIKQKKFDISLKDLLKFWNEALHSLKSMKDHGILHRDVKPSNFLVDFRGSDGSNVQEVTFKLGDFGCGRGFSKDLMEMGDLKEFTKNLGTDGYMSPEIAPLLGEDDNSGAYTYQADLWSLSVSVFYIASRGKKPFMVQRLSSLHQEINTDSRRNGEIMDIIRVDLAPSFSSIFSILEETVKWNPVDRYTAEKCLNLVEHMQKQDGGSALAKQAPTKINIPISTIVVPQDKVPNEAKVKEILGLKAYDTILEWCDNDSIKVDDILKLAQNLDPTSRLHQDMKKEKDLHVKHSTQIHCRKMFSMWYKMCGTDVSLHKFIRCVEDPALCLKGLAMELSKLSEKDTITEIAENEKNKLERHLSKEINPEPKVPTVVLLGKTGEGKSKLGNTLLGTNDFEVSDGCKSVTEDVKECKGFLNNNKELPLRVIDTPGFDDSSRRDQEHLYAIVEHLQKIGSINAFIWVMRSTNSRFTASLGDMLRTFQLSFGFDFWNHLYIKTKKAKNTDQFIEKLSIDFDHSRHVDIASNILQLDCSSDFATSEQYNKVLLPFYESLLTMGTFDCRDINKIKIEGTQIKIEFEKLKIENSKLQEQVCQLKGIKHINVDETNEGGLGTKEIKPENYEIKKADQMLYVPENITVKHNIPSSETNHTLKPLELKKDNYLLTFTESNHNNEKETKDIDRPPDHSETENGIIEADVGINTNVGVVEKNEKLYQDPTSCPVNLKPTKAEESPTNFATGDAQEAKTKILNTVETDDSLRNIKESTEPSSDNGIITTDDMDLLGENDQLKERKLQLDSDSSCHSLEYMSGNIEEICIDATGSFTPQVLEQFLLPRVSKTTKVKLDGTIHLNSALAVVLNNFPNQKYQLQLLDCVVDVSNTECQTNDDSQIETTVSWSGKLKLSNDEDYRTLSWFHHHVKNISYRWSLNQMECKGKVPYDTAMVPLQAGMANATRLNLYNFQCVSPAQSSSLVTTSFTTKEWVALYSNSSLYGLHTQLVDNLLGNSHEVQLWNGCSLDIAIWRQWANQVEGRRRDGNQVLKRIALGDVDMRQAAEYFAMVASQVERVEFCFSSLNTVIWKQWAGQLERRRRDGKHVLRDLVIGSVDVRPAGEYFAMVASQVEVVELTGSTEITEQQWKELVDALTTNKMSVLGKFDTTKLDSDKKNMQYIQQIEKFILYNIDLPT